jgi:hypothetical protein
LGAGNVSSGNDHAHRQWCHTDCAEGLRRNAICPSIRVAHPEVARERVHQSFIIEDRIFVGVIRRSSTNERRDQCALAGMRPAGNDNGTAAPANNARVHEEPRPCSDGDVEMK